MLDNYKHDEPVQLIYDEKTKRHVHIGVGKIPKLPTPQDILKACAKLQKAGADLSEMTIVHDQDDMIKFWIVSKKDLKRNQR